MVKIDQYKFGKFVGKMSILTLIIHGEILGVPLVPSRGAIGHVQNYDHGEICRMLESCCMFLNTID